MKKFGFLLVLIALFAMTGASWAGLAGNEVFAVSFDVNGSKHWRDNLPMGTGDDAAGITSPYALGGGGVYIGSVIGVSASFDSDPDGNAYASFDVIGQSPSVGGKHLKPSFSGALVGNTLRYGSFSFIGANVKSGDTVSFDLRVESVDSPFDPAEYASADIRVEFKALNPFKLISGIRDVAVNAKTSFDLFEKVGGAPSNWTVASIDIKSALDAGDNIIGDFVWTDDTPAKNHISFDLHPNKRFLVVSVDNFYTADTTVTVTVETGLTINYSADVDVVGFAPLIGTQTFDIKVVVPPAPKPDPGGGGGGGGGGGVVPPKPIPPAPNPTDPVTPEKVQENYEKAKEVVVEGKPVTVAENTVLLNQNKDALIAFNSGQVAGGQMPLAIELSPTNPVSKNNVVAAESAGLVTQFGSDMTGAILPEGMTKLDIMPYQAKAGVSEATGGEAFARIDFWVADEARTALKAAGEKGDFFEMEFFVALDPATTGIYLGNVNLVKRRGAEPGAGEIRLKVTNNPNAALEAGLKFSEFGGTVFDIKKKTTMEKESIENVRKGSYDLDDLWSAELVGIQNDKFTDYKFEIAKLTPASITKESLQAIINSVNNPVPVPDPGKSSSSGGCSAGFFAPFALLFAAPLFFRKKK